MESSEKGSGCCLKGLTDKVKKYRYVPLEKKAQISFGRSPNSGIKLPETMISRNHATLKKTETDWVVIDNKSLNGVFVNEQKIDPQKPRILKDGDFIQLGVAPDVNSQPEFVWQFLMSGAFKKHNDKPDGDIGKKRTMELNVPELKTSPSKKQKMEWSPSKDVIQMKLKLEKQESIALKQIAEKTDELEKLQAQLKQKNQIHDKMLQKLEKKEEEMQDALVQQQKNYNKQREHMEQEIRFALEKELKEKEDLLKDVLKEERERLLSQKEKVEENLQKEAERKLEEKNKKLETELLAEKAKLENIIEQKKLEHANLVQELDTTKNVAKQEQDKVLKAKEDVLAGISGVMERELSCSICGELFIQATSLNCSHTFCALCIAQWMDLKKQCPVCRQPIESQTRSIALDTYIDKMIDYYPDDVKQRRTEVVAQRKDALTAFEVEVAQRTPRRRRRPVLAEGQELRRSPRRQRQGQANPLASPIVIDSESSDVDTHLNNSNNNNSDTDEDSDVDVRDSQFSDVEHFSSDSQSSLEGDPSAVYGGYGRCYRCGRRGHWAPGCLYV